jgi:chromate reductase
LSEAKGITVLAICGSLRQGSYNKAALRVAMEEKPSGMTIETADIGSIPLYNEDVRALGFPPPVEKLRAQIAAADALLFATPEYNYSMPGVLKNAIDWASRPWGQNSFDHIPAAVIGASIGQVGTAVAQQSLRAVLSFCNARQMTAPEAYIQFSSEIFPGDGEVTDPSVKTFLETYLGEFHDHIVRVLTVLPRRPEVAADR